MEAKLQKPLVGYHELKFKWELLIGVARLLPHFDLNWTKEQKDSWHDSFLSIISAGINLSHLQDDLELYERDRKDQLSSTRRQLVDYRE